MNIDLDELYREQVRKKFPSVPNYAINCLKRKKSNSASNSLTKSIIEYINYQHLGFAFRVNTTGIKRKVEGKGEIYTPTTMTKGTADILCCLKNGRFLAIEVKIGKDMQSEAQKSYQHHVEKNCGIYIIATSLDNFLEQIKKAI